MVDFLRKLLGVSLANDATASPQPVSANTISYTLRQGKVAPTDEVFHAWTSVDLGKMLKALNVKTNPVDRHFLLMGIVGLAYKDRSRPEMAELCCKIADLHLSEFPDIADPLKESMGGVLPRVTTFQQYATLLAERGEFDKAAQVCQQAISFGLRDGTKSGFAGRIKRIAKLRPKV